MTRLEDLTRGATVKGILPDDPVTVVDVKWFGSTVVELTYKDAAGRLGNELLYRDREPALEIVAAGHPWSLEGDEALVRLASQAYRIRLAHLFDPLLAVHTSLIEPLPHQIAAVYSEMLTRQPLRFLPADSPKEQLVKFDGTSLFPERFAYTVNYKLSDPEAHLYREVTDYVRDETK